MLAATLAPETVFAFLVEASGALMMFVYIIVRARRESARGPQLARPPG
ncbi:MAG TPA: hypothetical protein VFB37_08220 [Steroidobacteraceae bacterium]|nr:hypothetical protein [Steroidobacteraceae bacterium]